MIIPMKPSKFTISISVESYDEKTAKNYRNCYVAGMLIVFKQPKKSIPIIYSTNWRPDEDCDKISSPYLSYFMRSKPTKSVMAVPDWVGSSF